MVRLATAVPQAAIADIAEHLVSGYWADHNQTWAKFSVLPGGTLTVDISGLSALGRATAVLALDSWTQATGIRFNTAIGTGTPAQITIDDTHTGAYTTRDVTGHVIEAARINVSAAWVGAYGSGVGSYTLQTFVHEIGHALGLGHAGDYNGSANYQRDASFALDSWQVSVMSYFSQVQNSNSGASYAYLTGPMQADVLAMQSLYGAGAAIQTGNTTYGVGSNAGLTHARIGALMADGSLPAPISFTVVDRGGTDSFNFSTDLRSQSINLTSGSVSSIYGLSGNLMIEGLTVIENAMAGQGSDTLLGNAAANILNGNGGNDWINGAGGNDRILGGAGDDRIWGGAGQNSLFGGIGRDRLVSTFGTDQLTGGQGADTFVFAGTGSGPIPGRDTISDFQTGTDLIDLSPLGRPGAVFQWIAAGAFSGIQQLQVTQTAGGMLVRAEVTGDRVADFELFVSHATHLTAADFIL